MPNNLLHVEPLGFNLIPPETTQRLWVPRQALTSVQVLGVIGVRAAAAKKLKARREGSDRAVRTGLSASEQTQSEHFGQAGLDDFLVRSTPRSYSARSKSTRRSSES